MDIVYYIWLSLRCGAGSESGSLLLDEYGSPRAVYELSCDELLSIEYIPVETREALCDKDLDYPQRIYEYCKRNNVGILTLDDDIYPERLRRIYAKPILLYYRGRIIDIDDNVMIACVGTRRCSEHGFRAAYKLGAELCEAGACVVSGMAAGIDSSCARGALSVRGYTIAVLGCGIDIVYPPQNKELYAQIARHGAIITEYAPGSAPEGSYFPIRNRIISGLCQGTCVVEADSHSGALITARLAEKQGRDVFAFPGRVDEDKSRGTNTLIYSGARLVRGAYDIISEYELLYPHKIFSERINSRKFYDRSEIHRDAAYAAPTSPKKQSAKKPCSQSTNGNASLAEPTKASADEKKARISAVLEHLSETARAAAAAMEHCNSLDDIKADVEKALSCKIDTGELLSALTELEICGVCRAIPGGGYALT